MKVFIYILMVLAVILIAYNITMIDFNAPFKGDSIVAVITTVAGLCAILILTILLVSRKINNTVKKKS